MARGECLFSHESKTDASHFLVRTQTNTRNCGRVAGKQQNLKRFKVSVTYLQASEIIVSNNKRITGLEIKKILRAPFGNQLEKYSRQMQIFSRQFVYVNDAAHSQGF